MASNSTHGYAADRPVSGNTTRYQLNLFPIGFSQTTVPVAIGPYVDGPNLDGLREVHPGVRFLRYSDDGRLIYAWAPNGPDPPIDGFRKATANVVAEARLAAAMVRGALGDRLQARGLTFLGRGAYANFSRGNYLDKVWPGHPPEVGVHPRVLVGTEILEFPEQTPKVFLRVDMEHAVRIDISVYDLLRQGLTVNGRYVRARAEFTPEYGTRLLGRIAHHDENELLLDDTRDGVPIRIAANSCLFEEHRENLLAVVALYDPKLVVNVKQDLRAASDVALHDEWSRMIAGMTHPTQPSNLMIGLNAPQFNRDPLYYVQDGPWALSPRGGWVGYTDDEGSGYFHYAWTAYIEPAPLNGRCGLDAGAAVFWAGLGGTSGSDDLGQAGTELGVGSGGPDGAFWYETNLGTTIYPSGAHATQGYEFSVDVSYNTSTDEYTYYYYNSYDGSYGTYHSSPVSYVGDTTDFMAERLYEQDFTNFGEMKWAFAESAIQEYPLDHYPYTNWQLTSDGYSDGRIIATANDTGTGSTPTGVSGDGPFDIGMNSCN